MAELEYSKGKIPNIVSYRIICSPIASKPVSLDAEFNSESHGMRRFALDSELWLASYRPQTEYSNIFQNALAP